jgi:hypothetical protein
MSWTCNAIFAILVSVWSGFDPDLYRQLLNVREMVRLQHQTPTREWPLIVMESQEQILVVREWPNGTITAYTMPLPASNT